MWKFWSLILCTLSSSHMKSNGYRRFDWLWGCRRCHASHDLLPSSISKNPSHVEDPPSSAHIFPPYSRVSSWSTNRGVGGKVCDNDSLSGLVLVVLQICKVPFMPMIFDCRNGFFAGCSLHSNLPVPKRLYPCPIADSPPLHVPDICHVHSWICIPPRGESMLSILTLWESMYYGIRVNKCAICFPANSLQLDEIWVNFFNPNWTLLDAFSSLTRILFDYLFVLVVCRRRGWLFGIMRTFLVDRHGAEYLQLSNRSAGTLKSYLPSTTVTTTSTHAITIQ